MTNSPLVSVVMASYNHGAHILEAVNSVLRQEDVDLELLIEDDGSVDDTHNILRKIDDKRVSVVCRSVNQGACATVNNLIARAQGEFIALINSDDVWSTHSKLREQVTILRANPGVGAVFGRAGFIDATGSTVSAAANFYGNIFQQENRSQGQWLRRFFFYGNCLCHPTMLIRRQCYEKTGLYDNRLRQLPDLMMWIKLVKHYDILVSDQIWVDFRLIGEANASAPTPANAMRGMNEQFLQYEDFWDGVDVQQLREGFLDLLQVWTLPTPVHLEIEKVLLYCKAGKSVGGALRLLGVQKMHRMLASAAHREVLAKDYAITDAWLHRELGMSSPFSAIR